jgi:uncharacterized protein (TIGR01777 family)
VVRLKRENHDVVVLTRNVDRARQGLPSGISLERWDGATQGSWLSSLEGADVLMNLAGESVAARRWTPSQKERILRSRVGGTRVLVRALRSVDRRPSILLNASAVGYYGLAHEEGLTEESPQGSGFLADTARAWEDEACAAETLGVRVIRLRISNVLGGGGGALPKIVLPFRFFMGGHLGSGRQWFPWIHLDDLVRGCLFLIDQKAVSGPVNAVAPEGVTMGTLASSIGRVLRRPSWIPVPSFVLKLLLGEMSEVVLEGARVLPQKLSRAGFQFQFPDLKSALTDLLH